MANERRLIDAGELLTDPYFQDETIPERLLFIEAVNDSPTVDAVVVVRCGKCVYGVRSDSDKSLWLCTKDAEYDEDSGMYFGFSSWHDADFYCAYGEGRCD